MAGEGKVASARGAAHLVRGDKVQALLLAMLDNAVRIGIIVNGSRKRSM